MFHYNSSQAICSLAYRPARPAFFLTYFIDYLSPVDRLCINIPVYRRMVERDSGDGSPGRVLCCCRGVSDVRLCSAGVQCWMRVSQYAGYLIIVVGRERSGFVAAESITLQAGRLAHNTAPVGCCVLHVCPGAGALEPLLKILFLLFVGTLFILHCVMLLLSIYGQMAVQRST